MKTKEEKSGYKKFRKKGKIIKKLKMKSKNKNKKEKQKEEKT